MNRNHLINGAAVGIATFSLALPSAMVMADASQFSLKAKAIARQNATLSDVSLALGGTLKGRVVNHSGLVMRNAVVTIIDRGQKLGETNTDDEGLFSFKGLHGGIYHIASGNTVGVFRVWKEKTAPPASGEYALLVLGQDGARGQFAAMGTAQFLMAASAGPAVGLGTVALSNSSTTPSVASTVVQAPSAVANDSLGARSMMIHPIEAMPVRDQILVGPKYHPVVCPLPNSP